MKNKKQKRYFEKSGLVNPAVSYHVPLENVTNTDNQDIKTMVDQGRFFSIFAPRQSGKTTFFRDICHDLEKDPTYVAILLNFETYSGLDKLRFYEYVRNVIRIQLIDRLTLVGCRQLDRVNEHMNSQKVMDNVSFGDLLEGLNKIIQFKKIVIFIDEFDGIPLDELGSFLTTLRDLYQKYKQKNNKALYSVGLVGVRNITKLVVGGVSPFNIADEVNLPPFSLKSIRKLYSQYTEETNQPFTEEAVKRVYEVTAGQPWLVNRLGSILTVNIKPGVTESITAQNVDKAKELLLREFNKHFDNLWEKIKGYEETFISIATGEVSYSPYEEGQSWLRQFGLIKDENGKAVVANSIYQKLFLNALQNRGSSSDKTILRDNVFISYSHKDMEWLKKIQTHLKVLKTEGITYNFWDDTRIKPGMKWSEEIAAALKAAKVAILLVSTDFLASDFISEKELSPLLDAVENEGAVVLPLIIKPCRFSTHPHLSQFQTVNDPKKPLSNLTEDEQDEILLALMDRIAELVKGTGQP